MLALGGPGLPLLLGPPGPPLCLLLMLLAPFLAPQPFCPALASSPGSPSVTLIKDPKLTALLLSLPHWPLGPAKATWLGAPPRAPDPKSEGRWLHHHPRAPPNLTIQNQLIL